MSSERGNAKRSRPQKYQNHTVFKKDMYGTTPHTKLLDSLKIDGICGRCKDQIDWKIKFKKYKKLTAPGICTKCSQRTIKEAYHTICRSCASLEGKCPKCCKPLPNSSSADPEDPLSNLGKATVEIGETKSKSPSKGSNSSPDLSSDDDQDSDSE